MPDYGRFECVALTNHLYTHSSRSVPSISFYTKHQLSLFFRRTGQAEYIRECQKYAKLQYTNASFNLKSECLRMWVQSVTKFANKQKRKKIFMSDYGRLECVALPNHLYSHSSRSVPSISYM